MVSRAMEKFASNLAKIKNLPRYLTFGSTCTGTGNFELAAKAVIKALNEWHNENGDCIVSRDDRFQVWGITNYHTHFCWWCFYSILKLLLKQFILQVWNVRSTKYNHCPFELAFSFTCTQNHFTSSKLQNPEAHLQYACEIERFKQVNLVQNVIGRLNSSTCLFADVTALVDAEKRLCVRHTSAKEQNKCVPWLKQQRLIQKNWKGPHDFAQHLLILNSLNTLHHWHSTCTCFSFTEKSITETKVLPKETFGVGSGFSCKSLSKLQNDASLKKALKERMQEISFGTVLHAPPKSYLVANLDF